MSFRELRNLCESLRILGYPRLVSMESFRTPNFENVADILEWLVQRYDPSIHINSNIVKEKDRVNFLRQIAQAMLTRARIKLNMKRLYSADGYAVKELLKISNLLVTSLRTRLNEDEEPPGGDITLGHKMKEMKMTRQLASEITQKGAALYDLLENERDIRDARQAAIARDLDIDDVERSIKYHITRVKESTEDLIRQVSNLGRDEKTMEAQIEKKKAELESNETRLKRLQTSRPGFMDEYEKLELELQRIYDTYLERFRNLEYLEDLLDQHNKIEDEKKEATDRALKRMQKKLKEEEMLMNNHAFDGDDGEAINQQLAASSESESDMRDGDPPVRVRRMQPSRPGGARRGARRGGNNVMGSIAGGAELESDSSDDLSDLSDLSESDDISVADDDTDDDDLVDDDDGHESDDF
eukprot:Rmarinus@m.16197